ncbi:cation-dependent mannose-6-phosphate receptor-like [Corticium candelabrum]|uniref:cation-dependent mannose-6-phosphate receptor-like n=1 Tax=Corticium candelabrum TaxID=121492 RepID=UPI002E26B4F0|nr:cation-dependent mannose-6-phosphate receptor-like [Corticium candelabrum]
MFPLSLLLCLCAAKAVVEGSTCTKHGKSYCICTEKGIGIVNLTLLANNNTEDSPRFKDRVSASTTYYYNPCISFTELAGGKQVCTPSNGVAVCQIQENIAYLAGTESSAVFSGSAETGDLNVTYSATTSGTTRTSVVHLMCDKTLSLSQSKFTYVNQKQVSATTTYYFVLTSRCCCPNLCQHAPSSSGGGGLSVGSILLIVFFSLIFVYIIGGLLYLKFVRGASGVELIPNYSFWMLLPGLIKEGVVFLIGKCRGQDTSSSQYDKI